MKRLFGIRHRLDGQLEPCPLCNANGRRSKERLERLKRSIANGNQKQIWKQKHEVDGITFDSKAEARCYMKLKRNGMSFMPLSEIYCAMQENVLLQEGYLCNDRKIAPIYYRADFVIYENGQVKK